MRARGGVILIVFEAERQEDIFGDATCVDVLERSQLVPCRRDGRARVFRHRRVKGIHVNREGLMDLYRSRGQHLEQVFALDLAVAQRGVADGEDVVNILRAVSAALVERDVVAVQERELDH